MMLHQWYVTELSQNTRTDNAVVRGPSHYRLAGVLLPTSGGPKRLHTTYFASF